MDTNNARKRLKTLAEKIEQAKKKLEATGTLHREKRTLDEMTAQYQTLKKQLDEEVADLEAHGHNVGVLERSFMKWFEAIDLKA